MLDSYYAIPANRWRQCRRRSCARSEATAVHEFTGIPIHLWFPSMEIKMLMRLNGHFNLHALSKRLKINPWNLLLCTHCLGMVLWNLKLRCMRLVYWLLLGLSVALFSIFIFWSLEMSLLRLWPKASQNVAGFLWRLIVSIGHRSTHYLALTVQCIDHTMTSLST